MRVSVCVCHLSSFEQMNKQHSIQERQLFQGSLCVVFFMRLPTMWYHVDVSEARKQHNHVSKPTMRRFSNWDLLAKTRNQIFWTRTSSFFKCFSSLKTAPKDYKTYILTGTILSRDKLLKKCLRLAADTAKFVVADLPLPVLAGMTMRYGMEMVYTPGYLNSCFCRLF